MITNSHKYVKEMLMLLEEMLMGENLETETTEFKGLIEEGEGKDLQWLRTLVAFANTQGGKLYVGVEDKSHKVVALDHKTADKVSLMVHRLIAQKVDPMLDYRIEPLPVPETSPTRYVLCIWVAQSKSLPVSLRVGDGMLGIFVRRFGRTETASAEQMRELVLQSDSVPFDSLPTGQHFKQEEFSRLFAYHLEHTGQELTEKQLISLGFMSPDGILSKGALLFADACDDDRTRIVATHWPSDTKGSDTVLASETFEGNLISAVEFCRAFVANHSANGFRKTEETRVDYVAYPARSVTEGVVNAVGHRNYFIGGSQIEVNIFRDRLEITSPGALLGVRELRREHNIASIVPRRRNEVICDVLSACRLMEEKGSGFDKIAEDYAAGDASHRPFVSADSSSFTLTLPDLTYEGGVVGDGNEAPSIAVWGVLDVRNGEDVLSYCYRKERSAAQIAKRMGVDPSTYFRRTVLAPLVEQGYLIERKGVRPALYTANTSKVFLI